MPILVTRKAQNNPTRSPKTPNENWRKLNCASSASTSTKNPPASNPINVPSHTSALNPAAIAAPSSTATVTNSTRASLMDQGTGMPKVSSFGFRVPSLKHGRAGRSFGDFAPLKPKT
jgi:hypothetical protein